MVMTCPRCNQRPLKVEQKSAGMAGGGLVGFMLMRAFSGRHVCPECGVIPFGELSADARQSIVLRKAALILGSLLVLGALVAFLIWMGP